MKTRLFLVIATCILALAGTAIAQDVKEFAHGNGQVEFFDKSVSNFAFTAQRKKDGSVSGNLVYHQRSQTDPGKNLSVHMDIDCLTIVGNQATIQGIITKADPEAVILPGTGYFSILGAAASMTVVDGGNGNSPGDLASQLVITGGRGNQCQAPLPPFMYRTSNVVVRGGN